MRIWHDHDEPDESEAEPVEEAGDFGFVWGAKVPLRDGVRLNANIYRPVESGPLPAILNLTPYTANRIHAAGRYFAQNGYAFVVVDSRGRGGSEGHFEPLINEIEDGYDVVEWLAAQPWCDGQVAMWGGSYMGGDQWLTLKGFPPQLRTIVPTASVGPGVDVPFFKNIFRPYEIRWLTLVSGPTLNVDIVDDSAFWIAKFRELYLNHLPYNQLDRLVGNTSTVFQKWLTYPTPADYWDRLQLTPNEYRQIKVPILTITGHYDDDQPGALNYYQQHMAWGDPEATDQHYLVIGPWDHGGTRRPNAEVGGLTFGQACLIDMDKLHKDWYDWTLKEGEAPEFLKNRVAYYVMAADEWKYAESLEAIVKERRRLYLHSENGQANDLFHSGTLEPSPPADSEPDHYIYDPLDQRPAEWERQEVKNYLTDQTYGMNLFGNGLIYHSPPIEEAVEISGFLRFECWLAIDVPDTDFKVTVAEILPDGGHVLLTQDLMRARYRRSPTEENLVVPGKIERYVFDTFTFFSRRIARGSRLRLIISSPNTIHLQKNYNSGGVVVEETAADARVAHVSLHHDEHHPTFLEIPVAA